MTMALPEKRKERKEKRQKRTQSKKRRPSRRPLGVPVSKLTAPERKGYVRRWINDEENRIQLALDAGYEHVLNEDLSVAAAEGDSGSKVNQIVGTKDDGTALVAYLMEIPEDWHEEDQIRKQEIVDETERAIREGNLEGKVGQDGRYIPKTGIKISDRN